MSFNKENDVFCILPFIHLATYNNGDVVACCVAKNNSGLNLNKTTIQSAWNSDYYKKMRLKISKGEPVEACSGCYKEEKYGYKSHRLFENQVWERNLGSEQINALVKNMKNDGSLQSPLLSVDIRLGNECNLQCVMCRPHDSSKWIALNKKLLQVIEKGEARNHLDFNSRIDPSQYSWSKKEHFFSDFKEMAPHLKEMIFGGGEPLLNENHIGLLNMCIESESSQNMLLRYHTNGTVDFTNFLPLWEKFKTVEIFLSIDGFDQQNHYNRFPADWNKIAANIKALEESPLQNLKSMILSSLHIGSFYNILDLAHWIQNQNFQKVTHGFQGHLHPGIVHFPTFLSIQAYPKNLKEIITQKIMAFEETSRRPSQKFKGALDFMNAVDQSQLLPMAIDYFKKLDLIRQTRFDQVFPELNDFIKVYETEQKPYLE